MSTPKQAVEGQVLLRNVRLSFPNLFEPKAVGNDPAAKARYGCSFLIGKGDKANLKLINEEIARIVKAKFKGKALPDKDQPLHDGDSKDYDGYEGHFYLSANRSEKQGRPTVVNTNKTPVSEKDNVVYGGCFVNAIVRLYSQGGTGDKQGSYGKKICCSLETVQFVREGDRFGAPSASLDDLPDIEEDGAELEEEEEIEGV